MITEIAPAKINLYLHVGGIRADGLHELASLFVFTDQGDVITAEYADELTLKIDGPFAQALEAFPIEDNLILRAAHDLREKADIKAGASLTLQKNLPIASGIGGGSADAAAALRALVQLWEVDITPQNLSDIAFNLGADVPACLSNKPIFVGGAGEIITLAPDIPEIWVCLANPRVETPTGPIFKAYDQQNPNPNTPPQMPARNFLSLDSFRDGLLNARNDLEGPAIGHVPIIAKVRDSLQAQSGSIIARMSGSGATCFGLFANEQDAQSAAKALDQNGWWVMAAKLRS